MELPINYDDAHWSVKKKAREQYVVEQNGLCCHCKCSLDEEAPSEITSMHIDWRAFPPFFLKHPIHLHHSHETGMTIGAVHNYCNAVLWQYHGE
tara:strand:- start:32245 stop:32526 length:282 start_codon:yes stop_codon:yes gene_type:complete